MWWIWLIFLYISGWMATFRTVYLNRRDATQRWAIGRGARLTKGDIAAQEFRDNWYTFLLAVIWPLFWVYIAGRLAMFPRGIRTKFDREQEQREKLEQAEKDLEHARQLLQQEGVQI